MNEDLSVFECSASGVSGTTKVFVRKKSDRYVARVGIALFGVANRKDEELKDADPFSDDFNDNFAEGTGATLDEAIEDLKRDIRATSETLWL